MSTKCFLLYLFVLGIGSAWSYSFEENTALQYQEHARMMTTAKRRQELRQWFSAKRPLRVSPEYDPETKQDNLAGFSENGVVFAVEKSFGYPVWLSLQGSENLLANYASAYPFFEVYLIGRDGKRHSTGNYGRKPDCRILNNPAGLELRWKLPEATVVSVIGTTPEGFVKFDIRVIDVQTEYRLDQVDYPMLAWHPRGNPESNIVVLPDRRGRLSQMPELISPRIKEYPGSNARFQMTAFYDSKNRKGIYFSTLDNQCWEKIFQQSYFPDYQLSFFTLTRFPLNRARFGNTLQESFSIVVTVFDGDWYDAAQIYRKWVLQQPWAKNGPLYSNPEVPEFIKHAPLWLRFYLRASKNLTPDQVETMCRKWVEFLPGRKIPAELFHYTDFKEPDFASKYPVCEYYGYKARPYPGLPEVLKNIAAMGIRCSVFYQSEIINQFAPENASLVPAYKVDANGIPRLYLNERNYVCRMSPIWQQRSKEIWEHLMDMGFTGIYLDTFGKSKIDFECCNAEHGHPAGGGNTDILSQRSFGKMIREMAKTRNAEFFLHGEACTESFMDILDVKENATHTDPGQIPLERTLYGDYFLARGRTIADADKDYTKFLGLDFLNGMIPGRFYNAPPEDPHRRKVLQACIDFTDQGYEYLRCGQMLRTIPFETPTDVMAILEMGNTSDIAQWQNAVFHSCKDDSIAIYVFYFGREAGRNALLMPDGKEWNVSPDSQLFQMTQKGERILLGTLEMIRKIPLALQEDEIAAFLVVPQK